MAPVHDEGGGFVVLCEFDVPAAGVAAFRMVYGPGGEWAALTFGERAPGTFSAGDATMADLA